MKEIILLACAVVSCVNGGAVAWPGAIPLGASVVKTIIPPQVKGFAYSTSQYINAVPSSYLDYQPQVSYQVPQFGVYPAFPGVASYQPIVSPPYYPGSGFLYPSQNPILAPAGLPSAPIPTQPQQPPQASPAQPSQPAGDEDTAVIDSAEYPNQQQPGQAQSQPYDTRNMPGYPQIPQIPNIPQIPQAPQNPQAPQIPQRPQIPSYPQIPQYPMSGFQQFPQYPQPPQFIPNSPQQQPPFQQSPQQDQPQASFPSTPNGNQGLSDEDTVSVESA